MKKFKLFFSILLSLCLYCLQVQTPLMPGPSLGLDHKRNSLEQAVSFWGLLHMQGANAQIATASQAKSLELSGLKSTMDQSRETVSEDQVDLGPHGASLSVGGRSTMGESLLQMVLMLAIILVGAYFILTCAETSTSVKLFYMASITYLIQEVMAFTKYEKNIQYRINIEGQVGKASESQKQELESVINQFERYIDYTKEKIKRHQQYAALLGAVVAANLVELVAEEAAWGLCTANNASCPVLAESICAASLGANQNACTNAPAAALVTGSALIRYWSVAGVPKTSPIRCQEARQLMTEIGTSMAVEGTTCPNVPAFCGAWEVIASANMTCCYGQAGAFMPKLPNSINRLLNFQLLKIVKNNPTFLDNLNVKTSRVVAKAKEKGVDLEAVVPHVNRLGTQTQLQKWVEHSLESTERVEDQVFVYREWLAFQHDKRRSPSLDEYKRDKAQYAIQLLQKSPDKNILQWVMRLATQQGLNLLVGDAYAQTAKQMQELKSSSSDSEEKFLNETLTEATAVATNTTEEETTTSVSKSKKSKIPWLGMLGIAPGLILSIVAAYNLQSVTIDLWLMHPLTRAVIFSLLAGLAQSFVEVAKLNLKKLRRDRSKLVELKEQMAKLSASNTFKLDEIKAKFSAPNIPRFSSINSFSSGTKPADLTQLFKDSESEFGFECLGKRTADGLCTSSNLAENNGLKTKEFGSIGALTRSNISSIEDAFVNSINGNSTAAAGSLSDLGSRQAAISQSIQQLQSKLNENRQKKGLALVDIDAAQKDLRDKLVGELGGRLKSSDLSGLANFAGTDQNSLKGIVIGDELLAKSKTQVSVSDKKSTTQAVTVKKSFKMPAYQVPTPDYGFGDEEIEKEEARNKADKVPDYNMDELIKNDSNIGINIKSEALIFDIISFRYIKSALPRLFKRKSEERLNSAPQKTKK